MRALFSSLFLLLLTVTPCFAFDEGDHLEPVYERGNAPSVVPGAAAPADVSNSVPSAMEQGGVADAAPNSAPGAAPNAVPDAEPSLVPDATESAPSDLDIYEATIYTLLYTGFDAATVRCAVTPSFAEEYAWSIVWKPDGPYLHTNRLSENLWYAEKKDAVTVVSKSIRLEPKLARAVEGMVCTAVNGTAAVDKQAYGLDGISWRFSSTDKNGTVSAGQTWSPREGSLMFRLVTISDELFALSDETRKGGPGQVVLTERARLLTKDMQP